MPRPTIVLTRRARWMSTQRSVLAGVAAGTYVREFSAQRRRDTPIVRAVPIEIR